MLTSQQRLEQVCDLIFNDENFNTIKWHKTYVTDCFNSIRFDTKSKGVESHVTIHLNEKDKNRATALFTIGNNRQDENFCFTKQINFNIWKESFYNDFFQRLELNQFDIYVENIKSDREKKQERENNLNYKIDAFKRVISFYTTNENDLRFLGNPNNNKLGRIDVKQIYCDRPIMEISADADTLIKICALIGQNILTQ